MNIYEVQARTPLLLQSLLAVWEDSVRATHLFLSDGEVKRIKEYVPRALEGVARLVVAEREPDVPAPLWGWRTAGWRCCSSPRRSGAEGWENSCSGPPLRTTGSGR